MKHMAVAILVIGAGPAGLAAAASAAQSGRSVVIIDDNPRPGGQIWRGLHPSNTEARDWLARVQRDNVNVLSQTKVIAPLAVGTLLAETNGEALTIDYQRLIIATGARERFLPFPGWTLPGVMGAGGLQALVKGGLPIEGKRVVVAGTGPLLLAVAAYLRRQGARILSIVEQTPWTRLTAFALNLARYPGYIGQATSLGSDLLGVPLHVGGWIRQAHGTEQLEAVTLGKGTTIACDYLACGYGLVPNTELAAACGCLLADGAVEVDEWQRTSQEHIYCAGEATGIGGLQLALLEGQIAGLVATDQQDTARQHFHARLRARSFAALLERSFALRSELKVLATDDTLVCRCEDVSYGEIRQHASWRSAKLHTRCGMGPCQGRVCGPVTAFLCGWSQDSVRPPIVAARIESLVTSNDETGNQSEEVLS